MTSTEIFKYLAFFCLAVLITFYQLAFLSYLNLIVISIIFIALFFRFDFVYCFVFSSSLILDLIYFDVFLFNFILYFSLTFLIIFFLKNLVSKYSLYSLLFLLLTSIIFKHILVYLFHFNFYYWQDILRELIYSLALFIIIYYLILLFNPRFKPVFLKK